MKAIFILLIGLLLNVHTQAQSIEPAKGDNIVEVISTSDSALYRQVGLMLISRGYTFRVDKEFGLFKTDEKPLPDRRNFLLTVIVSVQGNKARLTGTLRNIAIGGTNDSTPGFPAEYRKGNVTMHRYGFLELMVLGEAIQKTVSGSAISYRRQ